MLFVCFFLLFFFFVCFFVFVLFLFFSECFSVRVPSGHMTFIQSRLNVDATSGLCIDVEATLYRRHVAAGFILKKVDIYIYIYI